MYVAECFCRCLPDPGQQGGGCPPCSGAAAWCRRPTSLLHSALVGAVGITDAVLSLNRPPLQRRPLLAAPTSGPPQGASPARWAAPTPYWCWHAQWRCCKRPWRVSAEFQQPNCCSSPCVQWTSGRRPCNSEITPYQGLTEPPPLTAPTPAAAAAAHRPLPAAAAAAGSLSSGPRRPHPVLAGPSAGSAAAAAAACPQPNCAACSEPAGCTQW